MFYQCCLNIVYEIFSYNYLDEAVWENDLFARVSKTSRDALMRKLLPGSLSIKSRVNELSGANTNFSKFRLSSFKPVDKQVNNFGERFSVFYNEAHLKVNLYNECCVIPQWIRFCLIIIL